MADKVDSIINGIRNPEQKNRFRPIDFLSARLYKKYFDEACVEVLGDDEFFYNNDTIKTVLNYFYGTPKFNSYGKVSNDPDLDKGLLIHGEYGVGKSVLMDIVVLIGQKLIKKHGSTCMHIMSKTAPWFTEQYMKKAKDKNSDNNFTMEHYHKGRLYIDDVGMEGLAFKETDVLADLLFHRHRNEAPTFITTNLTPTEFGDRYGARIADRIPQMFNIIKFEGKSLREE